MGSEIICYSTDNNFGDQKLKNENVDISEPVNQTWRDMYV